MQGIPLLLQIFGQGMLGVFTLLCRQVAVLGGKRQFSLAAFLLCSGREVQAAGETGMPVPACCPWELEAGFGAEMWDLRLCPGFAQGCGRLR